VAGLLGSIATIAALGADLVYSVTRPVARIGAAVARFASGDFSKRIPEKGAADVQRLAATLNSMARSLEGSQKALEQQRTELASLRVEATSASQAKTEFLSRMSHELRTPLNAILGFAQLLELDELDARQRDNVAHIVTGGKHLLDLINEVLEISRIETGSITPVIEPVRATDAVQEVLELVAPLAAQRQIELKSELRSYENVWISADRQHLKQVLLNLVANGVKYNRDGGSVTVDVAQGNGQVRIRVVDTGMGIPQDQLPKLFMPFERLGAESTGVEGTGLGLVLCLRLTDAMHGHLGVESQPWIGSTFWIDLPAADAVEEVAQPSYAPRLSHGNGVARPHAETHAVLYIEDDPANTKLMSELFTEEPRLELMTTMQGTLGLELARRHVPHLILLDLQLPDIQGSEILRRLRADPLTRGIPVIAVSADASEEARGRMIALGAARFLTKPFKLDVALATIWDVLDEAAAVPTLAEPQPTS